MGERSFSVEELFFSTTDRKGIIRSGNDVFSRVAAYAEADMLGRPHNLIRHEDMPRAVFQLLWDEILAGRSIVAYVKNRASTGEHYWVLAVVVPAGEGFLSVRLKPTSELRGAVEGLYAELRALERSIESGEGKARKRAIEASSELLGRRLAELGHEDYTSFMRAALATELRARDEAIAQLVPERPAGDPLLESVRDDVAAVLAFLDGQFANLNGYTELHAGLAKRLAFVGELAGAIRLFALNARIAATRLGGDGAALSAVADLMGGSSLRIGTILTDLTDAVERTLALLSSLVYEISVCKLQAEMTVGFADELLRGDDDDDPERAARRRGDVALLVASAHAEQRGLLASLAELDDHLTAIGGVTQRLGRELALLRALQMNGRIEAAALGTADGVEALFARIRERLDEASAEGEQVAALIRAARLPRATHDDGRRQAERLGRLEQALAA